MSRSTASRAVQILVVLLVASLLAVAPLGVGCSPLEKGTIAKSSTSTTGLSSGSSEVSGAARSELDGVGDEYLPQAGNPGYDVLHYDIDLACDPADGSLAGVVVVEAESLTSLDEFHLDLVGLEVDAVLVDGVAATYKREGQELIVGCPETVDTGEAFSVEVTYAGIPQPMRSAEGYPVGWQHSGDTIFTLDEPEGAASWYPLNDHPSDKATYSFRLTVPKPYTAVANGTLTGTEEGDGHTTFIWEMGQPMANYLSSVVIGELVEERTVSPGGVPIRDFFATDIASEARATFASTGEAIDYFVELFGPYPFDVYGVVVPDANTSGSAMENQTAALFGSDTVRLQMADEISAAWYLSHELAHIWFGDSVTLERWQDVWLNEGFATYSSWLWLEHEFGPRGMEAGIDYALGSLETADDAVLGDPGVDQLFSPVVYERGGLTLHALRLAIGDERFFTILRRWASEHEYGNVTTEDFIGLVEEVAGDLEGFDARGFFDDWLYAEDLPDW